MLSRKVLNLCWPHRVKLKESKKKDKYLDLTRELKKSMELESNGYTNCNWCSWYSHQKIGLETGGPRNNRTNGDYPNYSIIKIGQNTAKSHGDLRRLVVTHTPGKDHQQTLIWKILKEQNNNNNNNDNKTNHRIPARKIDLVLI